MKYFRLSLFLAAGIWLGGCRYHHAHHVVTRGFYYWKSEFNMRRDTQDLKKLAVRKMYIKMFDVDWNSLDGAYPLATVSDDFDYSYQIPQGYYRTMRIFEKIQTVPVVFITNTVFVKTDSADIRNLAGKIWHKILAVNQKNHWAEANAFWANQEINEIQIDCDWTASTKDKYFKLLKTLKDSIGTAKLSATIRLNQLAHQKRTGVPPVDRGMLMFYNTGDLKNIKTKNSILDNDEARKYLREASGYALPLDVALPIYSWGVVFRYGRFFVMLHNLSDDDAKHLTFLKHKEDNVYKCSADTVYDHIYLRNGDEIRVEQVQQAELERAARMTSDYIKNDSLTVSFFSWDSTYIKHYGDENLENIYRNF